MPTSSYTLPRLTSAYYKDETLCQALQNLCTPMGKAQEGDIIGVAFEFSTPNHQVKTENPAYLIAGNGLKLPWYTLLTDYNTSPEKQRYIAEAFAQYSNTWCGELNDAMIDMFDNSQDDYEGEFTVVLTPNYGIVVREAGDDFDPDDYDDFQAFLDSYIRVILPEPKSAHEAIQQEHTLQEAVDLAEFYKGINIPFGDDISVEKQP